MMDFLTALVFIYIAYRIFKKKGKKVNKQKSNEKVVKEMMEHVKLESNFNAVDPEEDKKQANAMQEVINMIDYEPSLESQIEMFQQKCIWVQFKDEFFHGNEYVWVDEDGEIHPMEFEPAYVCADEYGLYAYRHNEKRYVKLDIVKHAFVEM